MLPSRPTTFEIGQIIVLLMISAFCEGDLARVGMHRGWAWAVLLGAAMNAITFGTKRAFQGFLRVTRKPLVSLGLTAARFDMLSALLPTGGAIDGWDSLGIRQSTLRRILGVTAPVVTRMLKALEALGLVRRERERRWDGRQVRVWLTEAGHRCILQARGAMIRAMRRMVYVAICFGHHGDERKRLLHMDTLESYLTRLRSEFGDSASLYYPWGHPDD